ncbi:E3 ubiquitin/ISG15 ligase TRIM25 isoform X2 [Stegostoma tigrinum]|uniref:E3 ubiquitin/ISG15 ligase TRIM25 isoform X2 n=1 Tax=Stegostoma tigrinum TaxID=3053191 RepID=UPI002870AA55|nr:E3 ubiquitin/ISG15 ligase TRIM25 isoform X2 [Stegostoma tigrinum]
MAVVSGETERLEAELTCAVCLDLFREPVTAPCGHNFCRSCLAQFWAGDRHHLLGFTCPQCRRHFSERPELQPNRVLCAVVEEFERSRAQAEPKTQVAEAEPPPAVACDACPPGAGALAVRSCLTCLASFCAEHLEPHQQSAAFRTHNLQPPLADLAERLCPSHGNLLEFYCRPHSSCICAACLLDHRGCDTQRMEEARRQQEANLNYQRQSLQYQIIQLQHHLELMQYKKQHLTDSTVKQKSALSSEFNEIKTLIQEEEKIAAKLIEEEENKAASQVADALDQINTQLDKLKEYKEQVDSLLSHTGSMHFWKSIAKLPAISLKACTPPDPAGVDVRKVELVTKVASALKQVLIRKLKCPLQQRMCQVEQAEKTKAKASNNPDQGSATDQQDTESSPQRPQDTKPDQASNPAEGKHAKKKKTKAKVANNPDQGSATDQGKEENFNNFSSYATETTKAKASNSQKSALGAEQQEEYRKPLPVILPASRYELLQCKSKVTFDHRTAHKKLLIRDDYTRLCVAEQLQPYPDLPTRFINCAQVLGLQNFSNGCHYWEVNNEDSTLWAIGLACIGMDRKGGRSRLGRNPLSWCLERFGQKLSVWHRDQEAVLYVSPPRVVGVYLNCNQGIMAFYSVADSVTQLFHFKVEFQSRVYPAFWLGSSGTTLSLVQF